MLARPRCRSPSLSHLPAAAARARVFLHRAGRLIEQKDHEINVLQHEVWTLANRMQESRHMEALDTHRKTSKSLFPPSRSAAGVGAARPTRHAEEAIMQDYGVKQKELRKQIELVARLRAELTALRAEDHLRVSLTELVRTPASHWHL